MRRANRKDGNHRQIVKHLQAIGAHVHDLANKGESCDLLVGYRGELRLLEIKDPSQVPKQKRENGKMRKATRIDWLTEDERKMALAFWAVKVPYFVVVSLQEAQGVLMGDPQTVAECRIEFSGVRKFHL